MHRSRESSTSSAHRRQQRRVAIPPAAIEASQMSATFPIAVQIWYPSGWIPLGFHNRRYPIFSVPQSTLMRLKRELRLNMHAMKAIAVIMVLLLVVVNALELLPAA